MQKKIKVILLIGDNMEKSIWFDKLISDVNPSLKENVTCDILIIGGGIAGLSTALKLKDENKKIILIDKGKVGSGITAYTTGKLTYLQGDIYEKIEKIYDFEIAKKYLNSQIRAIQIIKENIIKYKINCDYIENDSYLFTSDNNLTKTRDFLLRANIDYTDNVLPLKFPCKDSFYVKNSAVFHPLKYLYSIKKIIQNKIKIYENTIAQKLIKANDYYIVKTSSGTIKAKKVAITSHYPFFILPMLYPLKIHLNKSYVIASKIEDNNNFNAINIDNPIYSIRFYKNHMIFAGYSHPLTDKLNFQKEIDYLINDYKKCFNNNPKYFWQAHDVMTLDSLPLIGKMKKNDSNLVIATGFNKWGMTNGIIAGEILSDILMGRKNKFENLMTPHRPFKTIKLLNFFYINFKVLKVFLDTKINPNKFFYITSSVIKINKNKCGVYQDENGKKHIIIDVCPHMKSGLIFNNIDKTWDCPCHGSRFDVDGKILKGPSVEPLKKFNEKI